MARQIKREDLRKSLVRGLVYAMDENHSVQNALGRQEAIRAICNEHGFDFYGIVAEARTQRMQNIVRG